MKNSDMPAMPMINDTGGALEIARIPDKAGMPTATGLTKREHFAGLAMQGMLSVSGILDAPKTPEEMADALERIIPEAACGIADALLQELEK